MNESDNLEAELKQMMKTRWDGARPSAQMEATVLKKIGAQHSQKSLKRLLVLSVMTSVAIGLVLMVFVLSRRPNYPGIFALNDSPTQETTLFSSFECPTAEPPPLTRYPQATAAPQPTSNPNATPHPTSLKKTRSSPRPTKTPMPTAEYLAVNGMWTRYFEPKYGYSFEYPSAWVLQNQDHIPVMAMLPSMDSSIRIWNYLPQYPTSANAEAIGLHIRLTMAFCDYETLEQALNQSEPFAAQTPLVPRAPVGGYPAWERTVRTPYEPPSDLIEVVVPRGKWLYQFQADPADSAQIAAFEHLLDTFQTQ